MSNFVFDKRYQLGILEIDRQHVRLVDIMEEIRLAMSMGKGRQVIAPALHSLIEYTKTHFVAEEKLMQKYSYPAFEHHKALHDLFVQNTASTTRDFLAGRSLPLARLREMLYDWLMQHILQEDKLMVEFIKKNGARPEETL